MAGLLSGSRPIAEAIGVFLYTDQESPAEALYEFYSEHVSDPCSLKTVSKFARPRACYEQSSPCSSDFFYQIVTSIIGERRYAYVLSTSSENIDSTIKHYRPISFVVVSANFNPEAFRVICLGLSELFRRSNSSLSENFDALQFCAYLLQDLVSSGTLRVVQTTSMSFAIPGDCGTNLSSTNTDVSELLAYLGVRNVVNLVHSVLMEDQIVISSRSMMRLCRAQNALLSLIYPFSYQHSCITILPEFLTEILESPTPFLVGVLSDTFPSEAKEYVSVCLDRGEVRLIERQNSPSLPEEQLERLFRRLQMTLFPSCEVDDLALQTTVIPSIPPEKLDKRIRAAFVLYFAEILFGYQYFVLYKRRNVENDEGHAVTFHSAAFCGFRMLDSDFVKNVLDSSYFQSFLTGRTIPIRLLDIFDSVVCMPQLDEYVRKRGEFDAESEAALVNSISDILFLREKGFANADISLVKESQSALLELGEQPELDLSYLKLIDKEINVEEKVLDNLERKSVSMPDMPYHFEHHATTMIAHEHRLKVLAAFVDSIFDKEVGASRKQLKAVELSMRFPVMRVELCRLLESHANQVLDGDQFDALTRLVNSALEQETNNDEYGVVYKILHLSTKICRGLPRGVYEYVYSTIQHHKIWKNVNFWTTCFYYDVHCSWFPKVLQECDENEKKQDLWNLLSKSCALKEMTEEASKTVKKHSSKEEEEILHAQAKHYVNLMICLLVPLDVSKHQHHNEMDATLTNGQITEITSVQQNAKNVYSETLDGIAKWIRSTVERVLASTGHSNSVTMEYITKYVEAHAEALQDVYLESLSMSLHENERNLDPVLISPHEHLLHDPLPSVFLNNCHESITRSNDAIELDISLLPAKGFLFITNYRIIFKGRSQNTNTFDEIVVYSFPLSSLDGYKKSTLKKHSFHQLKNSDEFSMAIIFRSKLFQAMKLAVPKRISSETIDKLLDQLKVDCASYYAYGTVKHAIRNTMSLDYHSKFGPMSTLRKIDGTVTRKKIDSKKFKHLTSHRGSFSPNVDYSDSGEDALYGVDIHKRYANIDYTRLGFAGSNMRLRLSYANNSYKICDSYPSCLVVPVESTDSGLSKVAKGFIENRFPIVSWASKDGALLIRASAFAAADVVKKIKSAVTYGRTSSPLKSMGGSQQTLTSKTSSNDDCSSNVVVIGEMKSSEAQAFYFMRLAAASPSNVNDKIFAYGSIESIASLDELPIATFDAGIDNGSIGSAEIARHDPDGIVDTFRRTLAARSSGIFNKKHELLDEKASQDGDSKKNLQRKSLYILVGKRQEIKLRLDASVEVVPIKYPKESSMRRAYTRLFEGLCHDPDESDHDLKPSFIENWSWSGWPSIIARLLSSANSIVSLMLLNNSSVALCLERGKNATAQLSSLVQILADPFYRTISGFQILVEKEWLATGHVFSSSSDSWCPVFLMFLDCVHQLVHQFPTSFEFSDYFLRYLAYHSSSGFFRTFIESSECRRIEMEAVAPEINEAHGRIVWEYVKEKRKTSTLFDNQSYIESDMHLTPASSHATIDLWQLYTEDNYRHGAPYDLDVVGEELTLATRDTSCGIIDETNCAPDLNISLCRPPSPINITKRKEENDWSLEISDSIRECLVDYIRRKHVIDMLNSKQLDDDEENVNPTDAQQKKKHRLSDFSPGLIPAKCGRCGNMITKWSRAAQCKKCHFYVHQHCVKKEFIAFDILHIYEQKDHEEQIQIPTAAILNDSHNSPQPAQKTELRGSNGSVSVEDLNATMTLNVPVPPLCTGYLSKRGAKLKLWAPRYFVIYPDVPKVWYYDDFEQWKRHNKPCGFIDLAEFSGMEIEEMGRRAVLEVKTRQRAYRLMAEDLGEALRWRDCIEQVVKE